MIKKLIRFILCLILAVVLIFTTLGYFQYKTAIQSISIEDKVAQIQADENYVSLKQVSDYLKDATVFMNITVLISSRGCELPRILFLLSK